MFYSIFQIRGPWGIKFFSNDHKVKESIYQDGLTTNNDHQSFRNPRYSKFGNIFLFLFFIFYSKQNTILFRDRNRIRNHFFVFFQKFKTHFFVLTKVKFFVIKFIDTKAKNLFFFSYRKIHDTCICFIINLQKERLEQMCLMCPKSG